eukprot:1141174-Pelagomonas_calceolata.AAC.5
MYVQCIISSVAVTARYRVVVCDLHAAQLHASPCCSAQSLPLHCVSQVSTPTSAHAAGPSDLGQPAVRYVGSLAPCVCLLAKHGRDTPQVVVA